MRKSKCVTSEIHRRVLSYVGSFFLSEEETLMARIGNETLEPFFPKLSIRQKSVGRLSGYRHLKMTWYAHIIATCGRLEAAVGDRISAQHVRTSSGYFLVHFELVSSSSFRDICNYDMGEEGNFAFRLMTSITGRVRRPTNSVVHWDDDREWCCGWTSVHVFLWERREEKRARELDGIEFVCGSRLYEIER